MEALRELFGFLWKHKKFWLIPVLLLLLLLGGLLVLTQGTVVEPFSYTLT